MLLEEWIALLKKCKKSQHYTGHYNLKIGRFSDKDIIIYFERDKKQCSKCGHIFDKSEDSLRISFNNPQDNLTIFQTNLLYNVFKLNTIPLDYARYDKCIAGQRFIENIREVKI